MQIFFDYRKTKAKTGVDLREWLNRKEKGQTNKDRIYDYRLLYVLQTNQDLTFFKIGIAGAESGKSSGFGRLHQYVINFGVTDPYNPCTGVNLLFLMGTKYSPQVDMVNSAVYRKELKLKQDLRGDLVDTQNRGLERIQTKIGNIMKIIDDKTNMSWEDLETQRRTSERLEQAQLTKYDKVIDIITHQTLGGKSQAQTKYLVKWNRPYFLTQRFKYKGKVFEKGEMIDITWQSYRDLIQFRNGLTMVQAYELNYTGKNKLFRH